MMTRAPLFMCFSAACVAMNTPRTLMSITRSISSSVVSSNGFGIAVPALFTSTSSRPKVATVFSTAAFTASASAASAWIARAFTPSSSIALTTARAALASFAYVMATFAPSAARRLAMAAPMPREPPVMSAIFPSNFFDIVHLLELTICSSGMSQHLLLAQGIQSPHWIAQVASSSGYEAYFVRLGSNASQAWEMEMELRHLRYFVAVAETESLSLAAKSKLHTSQPSLSRQLRDLEEEIGAQLMTRTARGVEIG